MKRMLAATLLTTLLASAIALAQTLDNQLTIAAGATARLALRTPLSSKLNEAGDRVVAVLEEEVPSENGRVALPVGTEFTGRLTQIKAARRLHGKASVAIIFESVRLPQSVESIQAVVTAIDDYDSDDKLKAQNAAGPIKGGRSATRTGRNVARGARAGILLGFAGIIFGGGLPILRIGLGTGLVAGAVLTKGNEIRLGPETILRIRFERPVLLPVTR